MLTEFMRRFWLPPRRHGEIIEDRTVSFLELFYDLVYVVVVGRAARALAGNIDWQGVFDFAVVFGLIWVAWLNGTLYYDLHGREDGRTRVFVFIQMLLLVLLAVYTADAAGADGRGFAIVYIAFLGVLSWLWYSVRRRDSEEYMAATARYLIGMVISMVAVGISIPLPEETRILVWAGVVLFWVIAGHVLARIGGTQSGLVVTDSLAERYGLFVIIVLGEVVVGVVGGLSEADRNVETIATGLLGLSIGFAYWWTYFDFVGRRLPDGVPVVRMQWIVAHLPTTMAIAAAGAAMVSLIEHGSDATTPPATAWLLAGSVAFGLAALAWKMRTLGDFGRYPQLFRPMIGAMAATAAVALFLGWMAPAPWLLAALLVAALTALWVFGISRWLALKDMTETAT
ncbi:MAG: low temperature requirement protein A [Acidimicrobiia bacterium]